MVITVDQYLSSEFKELKIQLFLVTTQDPSFSKKEELGYIITI